MARYVQAVARYGPRVVQGPHARMDELARWIADDADINVHVARLALDELGRVLRFYLRRGSPVLIDGLGRFRVTMGQDMALRLHFAADKDLRSDLSDARAFVGRTEHGERARWTPERYKAEWDAEFPDDPLELPAGGGVGRTAGRKARAGGNWGGARRKAGKSDVGSPEILPSRDDLPAVD